MPQAVVRLAALSVGATLIASYTSLAWFVGFRAELGRALLYVGWRESFFWLAHFALAIPGLMLTAWAVSPGIVGLVTRATRWLATADVARTRAMAVLFVGLVFALAVAGRGEVLLDGPVTDDESAVEFGARMVGAGDLSVPAESLAGVPLHYVLERDGRIYPMDFPGGILLTAVALRSGLGHLLFAALAALSALAVAAAAGEIAGRPAALAAGAFWLVSPMVLTLSFTQHPHLLARSFVALAVYGYCRWIARRPSIGSGLAFAIGAGAAFLCRPFEAVCLLSPLALHLGASGLRRSPRLPGPVLVAAGTGLASVAAFAVYNHLTTGTWYLPARFAPGIRADVTAVETSLFDRLGLNLGFNVMMLWVWFLGPLGPALATGGLARTSARRPAVAAWILASGLVLALGLALGHGNVGIHSVGPIHYSEAAVPLTVLAAAGLVALRRRVGAIPPWVVAVLVAYLAGLILFSSVHATTTLAVQGRVVAEPRAAIVDAELAPAVVFADPPTAFANARSELRGVGTWVLRWPLPDPYLRDEVLLVGPDADLGWLRRRFPERLFYRLTYRARGAPVEISPLSDAVSGERVQGVE